MAKGFLENLKSFDGKEGLENEKVLKMFIVDLFVLINSGFHGKDLDHFKCTEFPRREKEGRSQNEKFIRLTLKGYEESLSFAKIPQHLWDVVTEKELSSPL